MNFFLALLVTLSATLASAQEESMSYAKMLTSREYAEAQALLDQELALKGAGDNIVKFFAENRTLRTFLLQRLLNVRCERYLGLWDEMLCGEALWSMIKVLDFDVKIVSPGSDDNWRPDSFVFIAFKTQLINQLNTAGTTVYLNNVMMKLSAWRADPVKNKFNLWDETVRFFGTTRAAATVIASLLQDTSISQSHLEYLAQEKITGNQHFKTNVNLLNTLTNVNLLNTLITFLQDIMSIDPTGFNRVMFPSVYAGQFNNNPYHLYVPMHLSSRLSQSGMLTRFAVIAPSILSMTYEFISTKEDLTYLYSDPTRISSEYKIKDIRSGHTGARLGVGLKSGHTLAALKSLFSRSTREAVKAIFDLL
jgi:hypothetical protein